MAFFEELKPFTDQEYNDFCKFIYDTVGINLTDKKRSLVNNRLRKRLLTLGYKSYGEYFNYIRRKKDENELVLMINAITTNVTSFFRDSKQFTTLLDVFHNEFKGKSSPTRIWSAGCSTGQEPYTIAISLLRGKFHNFEIHASDLSTKVLQVASQGLYPSDQIEKDMPSPDILQEFFKKNENHYEIRPQVKKHIKFFKHNLMQDSFPKNFDIIFCRNVIIYFDKETKDKLFAKFHQSLNANAYLFLGHSESLFNNPLFKYYKPSIYKKVVGGERQAPKGFSGNLGSSAIK